MEFEWDVGKAQSNVEKHGVTFELATAVFTDPKMTLVADIRKNYGEDRFVTYGRIVDRLYVVVCVKNDTTKKTRIISARKANKRERKEHDDG